MSKLIFKYGTMNASKSANLLMTAFNYQERGQNVWLLKPAIDTRDGNVIKSRIGLEAPCEAIKKDTDIYRLFLGQENRPDCILVDEAQFLTAEQVETLARIVDYVHVPVICYGLRTDFQSNLFEGSARLMGIADKIEEIETICWCGRKAVMQARVNEKGKMILYGNQIEIGDNDKYISLCRKHWDEGLII